jgi:pimeloyl-ACP methyl ester carboxylesterase
MPTPEALRFQLPHIELSALAYGPEDAPKVLALHGWLDNAASFSRLAPKLPGLRIVALDFAGHGHSGHRPQNCDYQLTDYVLDVLIVADHLGWDRFSLLGHSLGAIVSVLLASSFPERVERLALVDGLLPIFDEEQNAPERLRQAMERRLARSRRQKPAYANRDAAIRARMDGFRPVSFEAAQRLVDRGLVEAERGYTWRSDVSLTLPTAIRTTFGQGLAFARNIQCASVLVLAEAGIQADYPDLVELCKSLPLQVQQVPGGHHVHLDSDAGADAVAHCFKALFGIS